MGGEEAARMAAALQVATGIASRRGGSTGGNVWERLPEPRCGSLPVPAGPDQVSIPVYLWTDAVLEGKRSGFPSDIRAIYNVGGNYLFYSNQALKPLPGVKNDYDIFCALSERLRFLPEFSQNRNAAEYAKTGFKAAPQCSILKPDELYPLRLISPHARYWIHSQNHNIP